MAINLPSIREYLISRQSLAPLAGFRVLFGLLMLTSVIRFAARGWIESLYLEPAFFFSYPGLEWIRPPGFLGTYGLFAIMALGAAGIALGYRYRLSAVLFFLSFTYVELIDQSNYLNHYYFVSLVAFLLIFLPAHRLFSADVRRNHAIRQLSAPGWITAVLPLQVGLVYFFAGLAKIQPDWLLEALPLRIWLPAQSQLPLVGPLLSLPQTAWVFSWAGMLYDLTLPVLLCFASTRKWAFGGAVVFHTTTAILFPIGMFPFIMLAGCTVFFPARWHQRWQQLAGSQLARLTKRNLSENSVEKEPQTTALKLLFSSRSARGLAGAGLVIWFAIQVCLPLRYVLYPGKLFWNESGYRFSWRVMLIEKAGYAGFRVEDRINGAREVVRASDYLTPNQEKMMATQPDMLLQFAHHLAGVYRERGMSLPAVYSDCWVSLNGSGSRRFVDPGIDLCGVTFRTPRTDWLMEPGATDLPAVLTEFSYLPILE